MFVKIFAVLYELHLRRLEALSEEIHEAYRTAFHEYYKLTDEHAAIREEYSHIPKYLLSETEKAHIGAAGGRQSEALAAMNEREKAAVRIDLAVSRTKARAAHFAAKPSVVSSRELAVTARPVVALQ